MSMQDAARVQVGAPVRDLCLFDLDDTLLPLDSDHAWGEFMIRLGWVDEAAFRRANDGFYSVSLRNDFPFKLNSKLLHRKPRWMQSASASAADK